MKTSKNSQTDRGDGTPSKERLLPPELTLTCSASTQMLPWLSSFQRWQLHNLFFLSAHEVHTSRASVWHRAARVTESSVGTFALWKSRITVLFVYFSPSYILLKGMLCVRPARSGPLWHGITSRRWHTRQHVKRDDPRTNILEQDPRVRMYDIYLIYIPGGCDPSALNSNAIKHKKCVSIQAKRHLCLLHTSPSRAPLRILHNKRPSVLGASGRLAVALEMIDVTCHHPGVPGESDAGGRYKDVFLQITRCANIQKNDHCLQADSPSVLKEIPSTAVGTLTNLRVFSRNIRSLHRSTSFVLFSVFDEHDPFHSTSIRQGNKRHMHS